MSSIRTYPSFSDHGIIELKLNIVNKSRIPIWSLDNNLLQNEDFRYQIDLLLSDFVSDPYKSLEDYERLKFKIKSVSLQTKEYLIRERKRALRKAEKLLQTSHEPYYNHDLYKAMIDSIKCPQMNPELSRKQSDNLSSIQFDTVFSDKTVAERSAYLETFFRDKFSRTPCDQSGLKDYLCDIPLLSKDHIERLSSSYHEEEILSAINNLQNNKSPGFDGLTAEFYKCFSQHYKTILLWLLQESLEARVLPPSLRLGVTVIIHKKGDPKDLKTWRPITLSNSDYKVLSMVLTRRLKHYANSIIGSHQTCNIKGRTIYDNLHFMRDFVRTAKEGGILSLDQAAAFDNVDHDYILQVLKAFGFPQGILDFVKTLYTDSCVMLRTQEVLTSKLPICKGVKQGDPVAPLLFVLAMEPLLLRLSKKLLNVAPGPYSTMPNTVVSAYADDTCILISDLQQFKVVEDELILYGKQSGGRLNRSKSCFLPFGTWKERTLHINFPVVAHGFKIVGIFLGTKGYMNMNWSELLVKFKMKIDLYRAKFPHAGLFLRAKIVSTFLLPIVWYRTQVLHPPLDFVNTVHNICEDYLWQAGKHWVRKDFVYLPVSLGGLGLKNVHAQVRIFRVRLAVSISQGNFNNYFMSDLAQHVTSILATGTSTSGDTFYQSIADTAQEVSLRTHNMPHRLYNILSVRHPSYFSSGSSKLFLEHGLLHVKDLMDANTRTSILAQLPAYKARQLEHAFRSVERELLKLVPSTKDPQYYVQCNLNKKMVELSRGNEYAVCAISPQIIGFTEAEIRKMTAYNWKVLKKALSLAEAEIVWKFRHDAVLSPSLAFYMKLSSSKCCPLCNRDSTGVKHYIACERAASVWKYTELLFNKAGYAWKPGYKFKGISSAEWVCLNHLVSAGYRVIYDLVLCKLNKLPHNEDLQEKLKRKMFEILYLEFYKARMYGSHKVLAFSMYWRPLNFLFKANDSSIDIRLPSLP